MIVYSYNRELGLKAFLHDLWTSLAMFRVWYAFAIEDIRQRYSRSFVGVLWLGFGFVLFIFAIALLFRGWSPDQIILTAIGLSLYQFLVGVMQEGCTVFLGSSGWISSSKLPFGVYVFRSIMRSVVPFGIYTGIVALMMIFYQWSFDLRMFYVIPFLALVLFNAVWVQYLLGILNAKFRDISHLIGAIARLLFFTTPILWSYEEMDGMRKLVADFNPFTHFVQLYRACFVEVPQVEFHLMIVLGLTATGWLLTMIIASIFRRKIAIWVT